MKRMIILILLVVGCGDSADISPNPIANLGGNNAMNNGSNNATNNTTNNAEIDLTRSEHVEVTPGSLGGTWYFEDPSRNILQMTLIFEHDVSETTFEGRSLTSVDGSGYRPVQDCRPDCEYAGPMQGTLDGTEVTVSIPKITIERTNLRGSKSFTGHVDESWRALTLVNERGEDKEPMVFHRVAPPKSLGVGNVWHLGEPGGDSVGFGRYSTALKDHFVTSVSQPGFLGSEQINRRNHGVILSADGVAGGFHVTYDNMIEAFPLIARADDTSFVLVTSKCFEVADAPVVVLTTDAGEVEFDYSGFDSSACLDVAARIKSDGTVLWAVPFVNASQALRQVIYRPGTDDIITLSNGVGVVDSSGTILQAGAGYRPTVAVREDGSFVVVGPRPDNEGAVIETFDPQVQMISSRTIDLEGLDAVGGAAFSPDGGLVFTCNIAGVMAVVKLNSSHEFLWKHSADFALMPEISVVGDKILAWGRGKQHPIEVGPRGHLFDLTYFRTGGLALDDDGNLESVFAFPGQWNQAWLSDGKFYAVGSVLDQQDITDNRALGQSIARLHPDRSRKYLVVYPAP